MAEKKESAQAAVLTICRVTRKKYSAEEKVRIVLEGLRGETSIAALCRREGIPSNLYYRWSKDFLEAGKQRLVGDSERQADSRQVSDMRAELDQLKQLVAELSLKNRVLKKSLLGKEPPWDTGEEESAARTEYPCSEFGIPLHSTLTLDSSYVCCLVPEDG